MTDPLAIEPLDAPPDTVVAVPGSKSITNRALVCAAFAPGRSVLTGVLLAADTRAMVACLRVLGARIDLDEAERVAVVEGVEGPIGGELALDVAQAGTVARFLPAVLAGGPGRYRIDGHPQMRARPLGDLVEALRSMGAEILDEGEPGHLPVTVVGRPDLATEVTVAAATSSQFASGLALAGPLAPGGRTIALSGTVVSRPYLDMTVAVMRAFGARVEVADDRFVVAGGGYRPTTYAIEPDASAASYFFAAAAITGGRVRIEGLGQSSLQGDLGFVEVLAAMGATVERAADHTTVTGPAQLRGVTVDLSELSDTVPTLAVVAPFASSPTRIDGVGFIRRKESDRIGAVVAELRRCGVDAVEHDDGLEIRPGRPHGAVIETYDDHRMAMSFATLGLEVPGIAVRDPGCVAKTFPDFFEVLDGLRSSPGPAGAPGAEAPGAGVPRGGGQVSDLLVIAIDGPAGSGKSTVARAVADRLGLEYLDTGAMYRAVAFAALRRGVDPDDAERVADVARDVDLRIEDGSVVVDGADATVEIRGPAVTRAVSVVAANPQVRSELVSRQREWARRRSGGVMEGRDIGTVVFPDASLKVYLTANAEVRAKRRAKEITDLDYDTVAADLASRDASDSSRAHSPLAEAADAVLIDTSDLDIEAVVDAVVEALDAR